MSTRGVTSPAAGPGDATAAAAAPAPLDSERVRAAFPILDRQVNGSPLSYLDSGASALTPDPVLEAMDRFERSSYSNVHRGAHTLATEATEAYEGARAIVARHLGAVPRDVIFTRSVTGSLNLIARAWGDQNVGPGDRILVTEMEHHANIVPWYQLAERTGATLDWVEIDDEGKLDLDSFHDALERGPKVFAFAHVSNVLGTVNDVANLAAEARAAGALVVVDGAQAAPKMRLDMAAIGADFYAFTGHKLYGPTGIGVLWGRRELLEAMEPFEGGGSMINKVTRDKITWAPPPARFEAGTPPITQAVGLGAAIEWVEAIGLDQIAAHELEISAYALPRLAEVPGLTIFGPPTVEDRTAIFSFDLEGVHPHDVSEILDRHGVEVRTGHHCAQILMGRLDVAATTRASIGVYSTNEEIDRLIDGLHDVRRVFQL